MKNLKLCNISDIQRDATNNGVEIDTFERTFI